ncbi:MAG: hypothetical protein ACRCZS_07680 [Chroococcidiopsis sp.]
MAKSKIKSQKLSGRVLTKNFRALVVDLFARNRPYSRRARFFEAACETTNNSSIKPVRTKVGAIVPCINVGACTVKVSPSL